LKKNKAAFDGMMGIGCALPLILIFGAALLSFLGVM
jgi:hypothetical protein